MSAWTIRGRLTGLMVALALVVAVAGVFATLEVLTQRVHGEVLDRQAAIVDSIVAEAATAPASGLLVAGDVSGMGSVVITGEVGPDVLEAAGGPVDPLEALEGVGGPVDPLEGVGGPVDPLEGVGGPVDPLEADAELFVATLPTDSMLGSGTAVGPLPTRVNWSNSLIANVSQLLANRGELHAALGDTSQPALLLAEDGRTVFSVVSTGPEWSGQVELVEELSLLTDPVDPSATGTAMATTDQARELNRQLDGATIVSGPSLLELVDPVLWEPSVDAVDADAGTHVALAFRDHDSEAVDGLVVRVVGDIQSQTDTIDQTRRLLMFGAAGLVLLAGFGTWVITGRSLAPVAAMTRRVDTITSGSLHERVDISGRGDEIDTLGRTMNGLLDRLDLSRRRRAQFVSDASHELRTPIAVLRSEVDGTRAEIERLATPIDLDEQTNLERFTSVVDTESKRLEAMVDDLLQLAKLDEVAGVGTPRVEVDLDDVLFAEAARCWPKPVDASGVRAAKVIGDQASLSRVVGHLVANATRHASSQVWVGIDLDVGPATARNNYESRSQRQADEGGAGAGSAVLWVVDDGPGVPPERRQDVFDRFRRLDDARDRDRGGAGLGLAVVKGLVEAHGGTVSVGEAVTGGARFEARFPLC